MGSALGENTKRGGQVVSVLGLLGSALGENTKRGAKKATGS